ncbi:transient receptor potential cation channel subfamily M member 5-like [Dreissena polymorpha]|uniref:transient receptor potential cation channel subfamily M member 5-like n=1 Tax=Dreissena polymorpha TaxID=45954 RepID=UPI002263E7AA|nr:transient receptor potential cation channel subfamily M member 5-like [Dreissena polymorpha]
MVFFVSFSVMYQANLYPNSPPSASLLKKLVYKPYWQIFGELFLDEISGDEYGDCTTNSTVWKSAGGKDRCPENTRLVIYIGAIYIILTQIVLVNLLIAVLSNTYTAVHEKSDHIWKFYWYGIVREYYERPALCPPLIILVHIYRTIRHGVKRCQDRVSDNEFRK